MESSTPKQIEINGQTINYILKISRRAKHLRLAIYCNGELVVTQPRFIKDEVVINFIKAKADWILQKIVYFKQAAFDPLSSLTRRDYLNNKAKARILVIERLEYFHQFYNFEYSSVSIRNQKTRWGSCSRRGGLNFNFRLLYLPAPVRDYVIVHELCHLKEFNHSANFWKLVAKKIPNFHDLRKKLKNGQLI
jgi:predicted metal-dependent hydrolase